MNGVIQYRDKRDRLVEEYRSGNLSFRLAKKSMTNLFRYGGNAERDRSGLKVDAFCHVLNLDVAAATVDVEGMATIETLIDSTLPHGLIPPISPELKHITVGGAIVGIGIESSCFLHGFFHESVMEAEVLLPSGEIVVCTRENEYADLYHGLPNSFGTLGYVLRATLKLMSASNFVQLDNTHFTNSRDYLTSFTEHIDNPRGVFLEGLFYSEKEFYLTSGKFIANTDKPLDIYRGAPFYKKTRRAGRFDMRTKDYVFRFDPDWFWNVKDQGLFEVFRQHAPISMRNSGFYTRYTRIKRGLLGAIGIRNRDEEELIQDWVVPWDSATEFIDYILANIDIQGQPWVALPIVAQQEATLYPLTPNQPYMNIGCYCFVKKPKPDEAHYYTKLIDEKCFEMGGVKMLYSSTFLSEDRFNAIYNGEQYRQLKRKYDAQSKSPTLYQKAAMRL